MKWKKDEKLKEQQSMESITNVNIELHSLPRLPRVPSLGHDLNYT